MSDEVRVVRTEPRPTAVVARSTTWDEFPSLWGKLLDQVHEFLKTSDVHKTGHNVMLDKDGVPNVEVGVEVSGPFVSSGPAGRSTETGARTPGSWKPRCTGSWPRTDLKVARRLPR